MSCVWKHPKSPFWIGQFTDATGRRVNRSTKQEVRRTAEEVAEKWEKAARKARAGELTQAASIKVLSDLMETTTGDRLQVESIESFLAAWLKSRATVGRADSTGKRYAVVVDSFLKSLDARRRKASVASLTASEIERWRDAELARGKGGTTVDFGTKVLQIALNAARRKGLILANPAEAVEKVGTIHEERDPFTVDEVVALLKHANDDWRGMILLGAFLGLRLSDASSLCWEAVNLEEGTITLRPKKTSKKDPRPLVIAMAAPLLDHLKSLPAGVGLAPIMPSLFQRKPGSHAGLSNEFNRLMEKAGIKMRRGVQKAEEGVGRN